MIELIHCDLAGLPPSSGYISRPYLSLQVSGTAWRNTPVWSQGTPMMVPSTELFWHCTKIFFHWPSRYVVIPYNYSSVGVKCIRPTTGNCLPTPSVIFGYFALQSCSHSLLAFIVRRTPVDRDRLTYRGKGQEGKQQWVCWPFENLCHEFPQKEPNIQG